MAYSAATAWMVMNGGADGNGGNGGGFDAGQTAGMATDGAATSATGASPVFSSASYNFVAGDVGAWVFIASGSDWLPGWYQIASVASNVATLSAAVGTATNLTYGLNTAVGCATTASPTGATWSIDYSRQTANQITYSDLSAAGAGSTFTSVLKPFGVQQVGNVIAVSGGANCTVQRTCIISVSGVTATFDKAVTTGAATVGAGKLGGALVSVGLAGFLMNASNIIWVKYNATAFTSTSSTSNVTLGKVTLTAGTSTAPSIIRGFDVTPGDETANRPTLKWGVNGTGAGLISTAAQCHVENLILDGNTAGGFTSTVGVKTAIGNGQYIRKVKIMNANGGGFFSNSTSGVYYMEQCEITGCVTTTAVSIGGAAQLTMHFCSVHDNTVDGVTVATGMVRLVGCILSTNKNGASNSNLVVTGAAVIALTNCTIYNAGSHGVDIQAAPIACMITNTIFESNGGYGLNLAATSYSLYSLYNGFYNNTSGKYPANLFTKNVSGEVIYTGTAFTNAAGGDFSLNNTASQGASLRAVADPGSFIGLSTTSYADIGAAQHQDSGGAATNIFIHAE